MNKTKISLISIMSVCMIAPAIAEPSHTSATFPNDELMQEDYTYTNQATYTNTGVYSGNVDADPEFAWTDINVTAGNYLPQNATATTGCTAGNFCPGLQSVVHYDAENDQGITSCSTLGDNSYTLSVANATSETDCYKACATSMVSHATTVTGNDYYGAGIDTCTATACENGWSVSSGACVANTININWKGASAADIAANEAGTCTYGGDIRTPRAFTGTVPTGKHFIGWKFAVPAFDLCAVDLSLPIHSEASTINGAYIEFNGTQSTNVDDYYDTVVPSTYGLTQPGTWAVAYSDGTFRGEAAWHENANGGCVCRITEYQAPGETTWQKVTPTYWRAAANIIDSSWSYDECASSCVEVFYYGNYGGTAWELYKDGWNEVGENDDIEDGAYFCPELHQD